MTVALVIILMLVICFLMAYPLLHLDIKVNKFLTIHGARYKPRDNKRNIVYVLLSVAEFIVLAVLSHLLNGIATAARKVPFIDNLIAKSAAKVSGQFDYVLFVLEFIIINAVIIYGFLLLKKFLKAVLFDQIFGVSAERRRQRREAKKAERLKKQKAKREQRQEKKKNRKKKKGKGGTEEPKPEPEKKKKKKKERVGEFDPSELQDDPEEPNPEDPEKKEGDPEKKEEDPEAKGPKKRSALYRFFVGIFFDPEDDFRYARPWAKRVEVILQLFVYLVEILYGLFLIASLITLFFDLPDAVYRFIVNILQISKWYLFPFTSVIFLQEICYTLHTETKDAGEGDGQADPKKKEEEEEKTKARLRALQNLLKKRFDKEHFLRYYPDVECDEEPPYVPTSTAYLSAIEFISKYMKKISGRTVQSYLQTLDMLYSDEHVYVGTPFYSEFGEYVVAYSYTRLLAGYRIIFVTSNESDAESLKKYIRDRLTLMTGSNEECTWRVYTSDERLDQADVFIATPEDFKDDNIVEHYSEFFEEVSNAIFVNVDRIIAQESYLCSVIANRLMKSSGNRISYLFISDYLLYGFASATLPRFFTVDKVLNFSNATKSECVSYTLWNRESASGRIYEKSGHKLVNLESIIAELACKYKVDGVRIMTSAVLDRAEEKSLRSHGVEINDFYKCIPDVNYLIYSDDYFNLAASLFACTRFRGQKKSVAHIISRPYMLREYFISKTIHDDYINRASFIQPRMMEHVNQQKLSLLRIFCDLTTDGGMTVEAFEARMKDLIRMAQKRNDAPPCEFCENLVKDGVDSLTPDRLAAYLIAGLCDSERTPATKSEGNNVKDYYLITHLSKQNERSFAPTRTISFKRTKEVLDRVFACNTRVELRLNDEIIGVLPYTFPQRVPLEYMVGMSIVYKNTEYEIEQISYEANRTAATANADDDCLEKNCTIFLRSENITFKNCIDTIFLRRYDIQSAEPCGVTGQRQNLAANLSEIKVQKLNLDFVGKTYGFYSLMSDRQTLDFYRGVEGNTDLDKEIIRANTRTLSGKKGKGVLLSLASREECTDGMRLLLAAVFNEFIKTTFPNAYRCIAVCPILESPITFDEENRPATPEDQILTLYPYINHAADAFVETDKNRVQLLFINDCEEDVGALDWFYDPAARYMQDWLVYVQSYLHWLATFPEKKHYIYFGGESLPACYDLEGCLKLLEGCNRLFSDEGEQDYDTANDDISEEEQRRCSFCHRHVELGRYSTFNKKRLICADCYDVVEDEDHAKRIMADVVAYLRATYPDIILHEEPLRIDPEEYELEEDQVFSEFYYRVDLAERTIFLEPNNPLTNAAVSILRGILTLWQYANDLMLSTAKAQLYYEELKYLRSLGKDESADWIAENLPQDVKDGIAAIEKYVETGAVVVGGMDLVESSESSGPRSSFTFMREAAKALDAIEKDKGEGDEEGASDKLYDPNDTPRFWKRYLRGEQATGTEDELPPAPGGGDDEDEGDGEDPTDGDKTDPEEGNGDEGNDGGDNGNGDNGDGDDSTDEEADDPTDEEETEDTFTPPPANAMFMEKQYYFLPMYNAPWDPSDDEEPADDPKDESFDEGDPSDEEDLFVKDGSDEEESSDEESSDEEPSDEEEVSGEEESSDEEPSGEEEPSNEEESSNEEPSGEEPSSDTPSDETPAERKAREKREKREERERKKREKREKRERRKGKKGDPADEEKADGDEGGDGNPPSGEEGKDGKKKKREKKESRKDLKKKQAEKEAREKEEEQKNPRIRLYNEAVRHAYAYSEEPFERDPSLTDDDISRIFQYVLFDYPEIFWTSGYSWNSQAVHWNFRCKDANGKLDVRQIDTKRKELKVGAKYFTKGITRRTPPYEAFLTIYRRLILALDYDTVGLNSNSGELSGNAMHDDRLRSLHSALVTHKVVCAGYAAALQYLLQMIGLPCGFCGSEATAESAHAFNIVKFGKWCYYVDATWGDWSNTSSEKSKDEVHYGYCCVPLREFQQTDAPIQYHTPSKELYPNLEELKATDHEYHRYIGAFMDRMDDAKLAEIIANQALRYDKKKMGRFIVSIRFTDATLAKCALERILSSAGSNILSSAYDIAYKKSHQKAGLLGRITAYASPAPGVVELLFD